jgi:hypothetical protein
MPDPTPPPEPVDEQLVDGQGASDPPEPDDDAGDVPVYDVTTGDDPEPELPHQVAGLLLPRRPHAGRRGVLLVDTEGGRVVLLDADDDARTFRVRAVRQLAGDPAALDPAPAGVDDLVRAAYETEYDVIAAPWAGDEPVELGATTDGEPTEPDVEAPRPRKRAARGKRGGAE